MSLFNAYFLRIEHTNKTERRKRSYDNPRDPYETIIITRAEHIKNFNRIDLKYDWDYENMQEIPSSKEYYEICFEIKSQPVEILQVSVSGGTIYYTFCNSSKEVFTVRQDERYKLFKIA